MSFIFLSKNETDNTSSTPINFIKKIWSSRRHFFVWSGSRLGFSGPQCLASFFLFLFLLFFCFKLMFFACIFYFYFFIYVWVNTFFLNGGARSTSSCHFVVASHYQGILGGRDTIDRLTRRTHYL
jgi:hypothetical protein